MKLTFQAAASSGYSAGELMHGGCSANVRLPSAELSSQLRTLRPWARRVLLTDAVTATEPQRAYLLAKAVRKAWIAQRRNQKNSIKHFKGEQRRARLGRGKQGYLLAECIEADENYDVAPDPCAEEE